MRELREKRRAQRKKMRRIALGVLAVIVVIAAACLLYPDSKSASEPVQVVTVQVESGDSLWKLADRYDNNSMDLREYIYIIQKFNNLDNTVLQPGQEIRIPVYN